MPKASLKTKQKELNKIAEEIAACRTCKRGKLGLPVPGEGSADADIVFLGEAPGKEEAKTGRPFIGRAGKVLRGLIKEVLKLDEEDVFITSPVKYFPPYGRPTEADIKHGRKYLDRQLSIIQPKLVVLMGSVACEAMLEQKVKVSEVHGQVIKKEGINYYITYHPAAVLHAPLTRPALIADFKKLKRLLKKNLG
jgi:uracil-DNA glycosylase